ncbi:TolC family protein [Prolixibacteraceae bacterium JC049]|nr:TolC family protein [Prolixibacteraceae bacterium JC049]
MKFQYKKYLLLLVIPLLASSSWAQKKKITLDEAIDLASKQSIESFRQKNMYMARYWDYRYYKADLLPSLTLTSNPLNFNRSVNRFFIPSKDEFEYRSNEYLSSDVSLRLRQKVALTGGEIFMNSGIGYTKNLSGQENESFSTTPVNIGFRQSLNGYNAMKWKAKIEPLKFEKAKKNFIQSKEQLSITTTSRYFALLSAQVEVNIAETNLANADTLYRISEGRFKVGTLTKDGLLKMELSLLNSKVALNKAQLQLKRAQSQLNSFLGLPKELELECNLPKQLPKLQVAAGAAIEMALKNNPTILNHKQRLLQEDRDVASAKAENGINADLFAQYGLNKQAKNLKEAYEKPDESQRLEIGLNIPIVDWGKRKGRYLMAKSNREVERATIRQERIDFEQNIFMRVMEFNMQAGQVENAAKANDVAQMGYDVTMQRFLIGKVSVTDLNIAQQDRERARRDYINTLNTYWRYYYQLRQLTLFDFESQKELTENFDTLIQEM